MRKRKPEKKRTGTVIGFIWAFFILISLIYLFARYTEKVDSQFVEITAQTLFAQSDKRKIMLQNKVQSMKHRLQSVANQIETQYKFLSDKKVKQFLDRLDWPGEDGVTELISVDELEAMPASFSKYQSDIQAGRPTVSNVSQDSPYYWIVGVPVMRDNKVSGVLQRVCPSSVLSDILELEEEKGENSLFVHQNGNTIVLKSEGEDLNIFAELKQKVFTGGNLEQMIYSISQGESGLTTLKVKDNTQVIVTWMPIGENDWYLLNFVTSDYAAEDIGLIVERTTWLCLQLLVLALLSGLLVWYFQWKKSKQLALEKERYFAIAEMSNHRLFEFDYKKKKLILMGFRGKEGFSMFESDFERDFLQAQRISHEDYKTVLSLVEKPLPDGEIAVMEICVRRSQMDEWNWYALKARTLRDEHGKPTLLLGGLENITERKQREQALIIMTEKDALTGLLNKETVRAKIERQIRESMLPSALLVVDIDDFKQINDKFGHSMGDKALQFIATIFRSVFRLTDISGRVGGDEFAAFLIGVHDINDAERKAQALIDRLTSSNKAENGLAFLSCSIGIAFYPQHGNTYDELFEAADHAMYQAKSNGKNSFAIFN